MQDSPTAHPEHDCEAWGHFGTHRWVWCHLRSYIWYIPHVTGVLISEAVESTRRKSTQYTDLHVVEHYRWTGVLDVCFEAQRGPLRSGQQDPHGTALACPEAGKTFAYGRRKCALIDWGPPPPPRSPFYHKGQRLQVSHLHLHLEGTKRAGRGDWWIREASEGRPWSCSCPNGFTLPNHSRVLLSSSSTPPRF